ncbi:MULTISPECIES: L,D-transpeptidase family protein [Sphingomonas]|uniref:L,D-transpeptidase family protein n=1 Tax=Sphingomonas TaxID=13687 RepID=UPI000DEF4122|nr:MULTISPECIES: L,D-transpeptidase family protein [Sphingomonas]
MTGFAYPKSFSRAGRLARPARLFCALALPALLASAPAAAAIARPATVAPSATGQSVDDFYAARGGQPLWLAPGNEGAAEALLTLLRDARVDGLDPATYHVADIERSFWKRDRRAQEVLLSRAFGAYVRDLKFRANDLGTIFVDPALRPAAPSPRAALEAAAAAPSLTAYLQAMGWMHPYYAALRRDILQAADEPARQLLAVNLERARLLPAPDAGRYVLVNAAEQRLTMWEQGATVDSMKVVVGKPIYPTPMMAGLIRYTVLRPYWNVPADLAAERVAPFVVKSGVGYLRQHGYRLLSDWSDNATIADPTKVDWAGVAAGRIQVRLRQEPGAGNSMGVMKFMFPNEQGIYLHDTPSTELFGEASRLFSGGCVRLEAAPRLAQWLYGRSLKAAGATPEQQVPLDRPVPVYITYLTAVPSGDGVYAVHDDIYKRDASRMVVLFGGSAAPTRAVAAR